MHTPSDDLAERRRLVTHGGAGRRWVAVLRIAVVAGSLGGAMTLEAQTGAQGAITGIVVTDDAAPVPDAQIRLTGRGSAAAREVSSDANGAFRVGALDPGTYSIAVRRLGMRNAELTGLRVVAGRATDVRVTLTMSPTQLSTVAVVVSPTEIDVTRTDVSQRIEASVAELLPTARDAASLVTLVPGVRRGQAWGGAGDLANDFQLDGVSVNHPGIGGDAIVPSIDWIEALEVRGLGAGAEYGNFQGGVINAITKSGDNRLRGALRANYESPKLTATNFNLAEDGAEQAGRREVNGELRGPIVRDRLFYFVAGQLVDRDERVPNLDTEAALDFRSTLTEHRDLRGIGKLTWLPNLGGRVDLLVGHTDASADRFGLTGSDDPAATRRVNAPVTFYETVWTQTIGSSQSLDVRLAGFTSTETREGYAGTGVPSVQLLRAGREPIFQNAPFDERLEPSSLGLKASWTSRFTGLELDHRLIVGAEVVDGSWRNRRTRNGNVTWRAYPDPETRLVDPADPATWAAIGSDWGGETRLDADVRTQAVFVQDDITIGNGRVTLSPGLRYSGWRGWIDPTTGSRFLAASASDFDQRIGLVVDVTGTSTLALKAHWGRYHQGMAATLFDRVAGANAYTNQRFYYSGPAIVDPRQTYTTAERDAVFVDGQGVALPFIEEIRDESGPRTKYRQPYVDQLVLSVEKTLGSNWKTEVVYSNRKNGNFVGLVDRNAATNYTVLPDVHIQHRLGLFDIRDPHGNALVLPRVYVSNRDIIEVLNKVSGPPPNAAPLPFTAEQIAALRWDPDLEFTTIPGAKRSFDQAYLTLRAHYPRWSALGSFTWTRLVGNVAGVTGYGGVGTDFSAGGWVRPNEAINDYGTLPNVADIEAKVWVSARLPWQVQGGFTVRHVAGDRFTPQFEIETNRYRYVDDQNRAYDGDLFNQINGQHVFVESRGSRRYGDNSILDLHAERTFPVAGMELALVADLFNVLGNDEITLVKEQFDDRFIEDLARESYGAPRLRAPPRTLRVGTRLEFGGSSGMVMRSEPK